MFPECPAHKSCCPGVRKQVCLELIPEVKTTSPVIIAVFKCFTSFSPVTDLFHSPAEDLKMSECGSERGSASSTISLKSAKSDRSKGNVPVFGIKPKSSRKR